MSLKDLFWKSGEDEGDNTDEIKSEVSGSNGTTPARPPMRSAVNSSPSPLAALRQGPTASLFTKTTGLSAAVAIAPSAPTSSVDAEFDRAIAEALDQDAKASGYREFMAQYNALSRIITDPKQCAAAALAAVAAMNSNFNSATIARAFGERLKLLSGYNASYEADSRQSEQGETSEKSAAIVEIDSRLHEIESEIGRLAGERAQCETQKATLQGGLSGVTQKYDGYRARFAGTIEARRAELKRMMKFVAPGATEEKEN